MNKQENDYFWLDFGFQVSSPEEIKVGMTALINGINADGEYKVGSWTFVFIKGALTKMKPPEDLIFSVQFLSRKIELKMPQFKNYMRIAFMYPPNNIEYFKELISRN